MAEKLTREQEMAISDRGGKLLVSAAAGSGKTKVLVDRLLSYLLDPAAPANLDEFLIITYTKAAASELRGKIAAKLTEKIAAQPENRHLQWQMQRLYLAKISTVHAFCGDILREYAYALDIAPDFRVADENECAELRESCMEKLLNDAYDHAQDGDFFAFVDSQGLGRDDRLVPEILLKVYDSARCHLDPEAWLEKCVESAQVSDLTDAGQTVWGRYLMEGLRDYLGLQINAMTRCAERAQACDGMEKPAALLMDTVFQLKRLEACETWDQVWERREINYGRLIFSKKCTDPELAEQIKAIRDACKDGVTRRLKAFADPSEVVLKDLQRSAPAVRGMAALVRQFGRDFDHAKRTRRILDFGDLEHCTLDLLLGARRGGPTAAAREIGRRFREIMVDEYQDSNAVQDAIFSALTAQRQNCFMVGDVKQSIYQFRLADPGIFLEKYNAYPFAGEASPGMGRKILLSSNFRSGGGVLSAANDVFRLCMSPGVGGLTYGEAEALREGLPHTPLGEPEVELLTVPVQKSTYEEEPALVAQRVQELLDGSHYIRQGDALRPIEPGDVAILLRSPGSVGQYFKNALNARGIRCSTGGGEDLLKTEEVAVLRAILQTVSNPRQDIPLIAALASPIFCFTADMLAAFRSGDRRSSVYDALTGSSLPQARAFLDALALFRREARLHPLSRLIETIFVETGMEGIYGAMPGGEVRRENLQTFYQLAVDFEAAGRRDLEQFLATLDAMEEKGMIAAGDPVSPGAVTLMSIHKSKGLEFPVVFVCGLSREFNRESTRAQVLCDKTLGLGLAAVDEKSRIRYPTVAKRAIAARTTAESLSEEMRVLYVALTRAKDRLIMTYASKSLEKDLAKIALRLDLSAPELLTRDVSCPGEWMLMAALRRTEAGELFALGAQPAQTSPGEPPWKIRVLAAPEENPVTTAVETPGERLQEVAAEQLRRGLSFQYGHIAATCAPSKQTATQRKGRLKDAEAAEDTQEPAPVKRSWRKPTFRQQGTSGTDVGSAVHAAMQYVQFEACKDPDSVAGEIRRLVQEEFLTPEQGALVDCRMIAAFFATELGQQLRRSQQVLREFKFSILDDGAQYDPALAGEQILLQGVVDCALIEPEGITVVDFKTDFVTEQTLPARASHYAPQVQTYAQALTRIYGKPVKKALLYFFRLNRFVPVKI